MPLNLAHLLNSAPASPPHSKATRATTNNGPEPTRLSQLLSPAARSQQLGIEWDQAQAKPTTADAKTEDTFGVVAAKEPDLEERATLGSSIPSSLSNSLPTSLERFPSMQPSFFTLPAPVFNGAFPRGTRIKEPIYQRPIAMNSFSYIEGRKIAHGSRRYESLKPMNIGMKCGGFDLHTGISNCKFRDVTVDEGLDSLLHCLTQWIEHCPPEDRVGLLRRLAQTEFVTWRGMMTKICSAVYENAGKGGWEMNAMMVNGTIYIEENVSPAAIAAQSKESANTVPSYYGHSYESLMTSPPGRFNTVDTNVQWVSVVKANLNNIRLILGGEVDCVRPEAMAKVDTHSKRKFEIQPEDFIEIKTSGLITSDRDRWTFQRYKMLKFWLQSFLLGTPVINVGFRDRAGKVCKSESLATYEIPALVKREADPSARWSASLCLDTGANILKFIRERLNPIAHRGLASFEDEFKSSCALAARAKIHSSAEPSAINLPLWQRWPVFRISYAPQNQVSKGGGPGRIEIRELDYDTEVVKEVLANKPPGPRVGFLPRSWIEHKAKQEVVLMGARLEQHDSSGNPGLD